MIIIRNASLFFTKKETRTNYCKTIKEQDSRLKREGTIANQCTKNFEFRRIKANFLETNVF